MASRKRLKTDGPTDKVLLVEGPQDFHTICQLLDANGIHDGVTIESLDGYEQIRSDLPTRIRAGNETNLGIVVDSDFDFSARWTSIHDLLVGFEYKDVPDIPNLDGTIVQRDESPMKLGVCLMPDNQLDGMLEDFARLLLPQNDRLWVRVEEAVNAIPREDRLFSDVHEAKVLMKTWLAWQKEPGMPVGRAIQFRKLDSKADVAQRFVAWHRSVFDLQS